jgi:hypothetical protein
MMRKNHFSALYFASIVSIGGFLFGFDASVIFEQTGVGTNAALALLH